MKGNSDTKCTKFFEFYFFCFIPFSSSTSTKIRSGKSMLQKKKNLPISFYVKKKNWIKKISFSHYMLKLSEFLIMGEFNGAKWCCDEKTSAVDVRSWVWCFGWRLQYHQRCWFFLTISSSSNNRHRRGSIHNGSMCCVLKLFALRVLLFVLLMLWLLLCWFCIYCNLEFS